MCTYDTQSSDASAKRQDLSRVGADVGYYTLHSYGDQYMQSVKL